MTATEIGKDGAYRMIIENRYKKLAGVRRDAKLLTILGGLYGFVKLGLSSIPVVVYGEEVEPLHAANVLAILATFALFSFGSGGGKPHKESPIVLGIYAFLSALLGSKAVLDAWNNPLFRAFLFMHTAPVAAPYDQAVAKLLVQKLDLNPEQAILDVDITNLILDLAGAFVLLASGAATFKYLRLKRQPTKVKLDKKTT